MITKEKQQRRADFCKNTCPVCRHARKKGRGILYRLVKLEAKICPHCRAYEEVYGKPAHEQ